MIYYFYLISQVDRKIEFCPTKNPYDPRWMLEGRRNLNDPSKWESGFFDKGSWMEIMSGWAKTVVSTIFCIYKLFSAINMKK